MPEQYPYKAAFLRHGLPISFRLLRIYSPRFVSCNGSIAFRSTTRSLLCPFHFRRSRISDGTVSGTLSFFRGSLRRLTGLGVILFGPCPKGLLSFRLPLSSDSDMNLSSGFLFFSSLTDGTTRFIFCVRRCYFRRSCYSRHYVRNPTISWCRMRIREVHYSCPDPVWP